MPAALSFPPGYSLLCRTKLTKIKRRALRHRIWFRVLSRTERAEIDLTMKVVEKVKSAFLASVLHPIIKKLLEALESPVSRLMRTVGKDIARRMSEIGRRLGCKSAGRWARDLGFIRFLVIGYLNTSRPCRT